MRMEPPDLDELKHDLLPHVPGEVSEASSVLWLQWRDNHQADACAGFVAGAAHYHPPSQRLASVVVHPPRLSGQADADGFREIVSRRRWRRRRRPRLNTRRSVPRGLEGKCFNCLSTDHVKALCRSLPRCFRCKATARPSIRFVSVREVRRRPCPPWAWVALARQSASTGHRSAGNVRHCCQSSRCPLWPQAEDLQVRRWRHRTAGDGLSA